MEEIDRYVEAIARSVAGTRSLRESIREEVREHIEDAVDALVAAGMSHPDAVTRAIKDFGDPGIVGAELQTVYGHSVFAVVADKAMQWKEHNMKSGWKWSFVAMAVLLIFMAVQIFFIGFAYVVIFPIITEFFADLGSRPPGDLARALRITRFLYNGNVLPLCAMLAALLVSWGLFEWRCKSESKATIRLACTVILNALVTAVFCFTASVAVVGMAQAALFAGTAGGSSYARSNLQQADAALLELRNAMETGDREAVMLAEGNFDRALARLATERHATTLAALSRPEQVETVLSSIEAMQKQGDLVRWDRKPENMDALADTWSAFCDDVGYVSLMKAPSPDTAP